MYQPLCTGCTYFFYAKLYKYLMYLTSGQRLIVVKVAVSLFLLGNFLISTATRDKRIITCECSPIYMLDWGW